MTAEYLIWSNEHQMWWRAGQRGYTPVIEEAGRYDLSTAKEIVSKATLDGRLDRTHTDPVTGRRYRRASEALVLAPESIPALVAAFDAGRLAGQVELAQHLMDVRATYDAVERAGRVAFPCCEQRTSGGES